MGARKRGGGHRRMRAWLALCLVATLVNGDQHVSLDDTVLDDFSVEQLKDPDTVDDSLYHQDDHHMAAEDVKQADEAWDVLFGGEHDSDLGEGVESTAQMARKALRNARKVRKAATKAVEGKVCKGHQEGGEGV